VGGRNGLGFETFEWGLGFFYSNNIVHEVSVASLPTLFRCAGCIHEAAEAGVKLRSLPECFSFIGSKEGETFKIAEPLTGPTTNRYQSVATHAVVFVFSFFFPS
jgi:predicted amidohydrolase